jgi:hypothetical protein
MSKRTVPLFTEIRMPGPLFVCSNAPRRISVFSPIAMIDASGK